MNEKDYIGGLFQTKKTMWWTDPVYCSEKPWAKLVGCPSEAARAECIGTLKAHGCVFLILQSWRGESKGYYCWQLTSAVTPISPLEQLAQAAE